MGKERRAINEVRDVPAEVWIKVLSFITLTAVGLVGYIGDRVIDGQDSMNNELKSMNGFLQTHETRISRNEKDISELARFHTNISNGEQ